MKATISSASVDRTKTGHNRFVLALRTVNSTEYFGIKLETNGAQPLTENQLINVRVSTAQLKAAIPSLAACADPIRTIMAKRSLFVGTTVNIEVEEQKDKKTGIVVKNDAGVAYKNVRLLPDQSDLNDAALDALFGGSKGPSIHSAKEISLIFDDKAEKKPKTTTVAA